MRKLLDNGSLLDYQKNLGEEEKMFLHLGLIVWCAFIYGVYGSSGQTKDE